MIKSTVNINGVDCSYSRKCIPHGNECVSCRHAQCVKPATIRAFNLYWHELNINGDFSEDERKKCLKKWLKHDTAAAAESDVEKFLRGGRKQ